MAHKPVAGVAGVLGGLISDPPPAPSGPLVEHDAQTGTPVREELPSASGPAPGRTARLGRPPGTPAGCATRKEKLTIRVDADLAASYRDWSWQERCQLGQLIDQALRSYQLQQRRR